MSWTQAGVGEKYPNWITQDTIRVCEYFEIDIKRRPLVQLSTGHIGWRDELSEDIQARIADGSVEVLNERDAEDGTVRWYKATALEVLDEREWAGSMIPIVKVIGDEIDIEGKVTYSGVVRDAKGSQQMYNYWRTMQTEKVALGPKAKWVMAEGQVEGHEDAWKMAHTANIPYLLYKPTTIAGVLAPPPTRLNADAIDAGVENSIQGAAQDMMATTGIRFDATLQQRERFESGRAFREQMRAGDIGSFHYADNFARSLRRTGEILIDLIPQVYDTPRVLTILREDDKEETVRLDPHAAQPAAETVDPANPGRRLKIYNPTYGKYGVTVTIGPSFATKRIEASESMMDFAKALPQAAMSIADLIAKNQDWPGAEEIAARLAALLPPQLLQQTMKDVPPQVQAYINSLQGMLRQHGVQMQAMTFALREKMSEQAIKKDKIDKDFEAKLLAIAQKADAAGKSHDLAQWQALGDSVNALMESLQPPGAENPASTGGPPGQSVE